MANREQQQPDLSPDSQYYDGETQVFFPPPASAFSSPSNPAQSPLNNNNNALDEVSENATIANREQQQSDISPDSQYYDGETQAFFPSPPSYTPASALSSPSNPAQSLLNNKNIALDEKKKKKKNKKNKKKEKKEKKRKKEKRNNHNNKRNSTPEPNPIDQSDSKLGDAGDDDCPPSPAPSISPRANDCSANTFRVYNHNVNGLRDETKIEYIPRIMMK